MNHQNETPLDASLRHTLQATPGLPPGYNVEPFVKALLEVTRSVEPILRNGVMGEQYVYRVALSRERPDADSATPEAIKALYERFYQCMHLGVRSAILQQYPIKREDPTAHANGFIWAGTVLPELVAGKHPLVGDYVLNQQLLITHFDFTLLPPVEEGSDDYLLLQDVKVMLVSMKIVDRVNLSPMRIEGTTE